MKTSNKLLLALLALVLAGITALAVTVKIYINKNTVAGNGNKTSEIRMIDGFTKINVRGRMVVILTQGANTELKINADSNLIPLVETKVEEGELIITLKEQVREGDIITLYVTADHNLSAMEIAAGCTIETPEVLAGDNLDVNTSAGAQTKLSLKYKELFLEASSGSYVTLSGTSDKAVINFSSGSNIDAENLEIEMAEAEGSSGGNASIKVAKELKVDVSSGANLTYSGNAMISTMKQSSGGSINKQ